jgi:type II secretory pathway pseudopilin PulG
MNLEVSASCDPHPDPERGYAMAALLVMMGVMAVLMTVALPTWKQMAQREKEEELIFRGTQYARALGAYQRKFANASPANLDILVEQHLLRRKYKDPLAVTDDGEFAPLYVANQGAAQAGRGGAGSAVVASTTPSGNVIGVASKNKGESLRTYNDHNHYNEWQFMALQQTTQAGGGAQGGGAPPGGGAGPGGRGQQGGGAGGGRTGGPGGGRGGQDGRGGPGGQGGRGAPGGLGGPNPQGTQPQGGAQGRGFQPVPR